MFKNNLVSGILSGFFVAVGGMVFLSCEQKIVGAILFAVALLSICLMGLNLYTGRVGLIVNEHKKENIQALFIGLLGNAIGVFVFGYFVCPTALPKTLETAQNICAGKLNQGYLEAVLRGFLCGTLMYTAVWTFKAKNTFTGIFMCVPVFIMAGFEHSIADMFYFSAAKMLDLKTLIYIALVVVGNSLGGMFIPFMLNIGMDNKSNNNK